VTEIMQLIERVGRYAGHGIDHEDQPFHAEMAVERLPGGAVALRYRATGIDGAIYQDQHCLVAEDEEGRLSLWELAEGRPGCLQHTLRHGAPSEGTTTTLVFGKGTLQDHDAYRSEIALDLWPDGQMSYRRAWGLPGTPFAPRSAVRLGPVTEDSG
jgi:hypothetical protein